jgi:hypothetical protein
MRDPGVELDHFAGPEDQVLVVRGRWFEGVRRHAFAVADREDVRLDRRPDFVEGPHPVIVSERSRADVGNVSRR